ncbi:hypothetical protein [Microlunatus speluncae]|uniref:hypothetical protein n=1 Tax=Microlunatus speluncae TaxID=2594267 RepID=UPI00126619E6|nr:hypothetical protein [Microlunatus speluncae]
MAVLSDPTQYRLAGALLVLAFAVFAVGAVQPILGAKGSIDIFTLPVREHLRAVADNPVAWRRANFLMGAAILPLVFATTMVTAVQEHLDERLLSRIALTSMLLAALLWLAFSAFRATFTIGAAEELDRTGTMPTYYEPLAGWGYAQFKVYILLGCLGLAALAGSLLLTGVIPAWACWTAIALCTATLAHLLITGDTLPAFHYFPGVLIGVMLLIR